MEESTFPPLEEIDLDRVKREAWIESYFVQALPPDRAQQLEDLYFQSDEASQRVEEVLQLQTCLGSRNRREERRRKQRKNVSPLASTLLPLAILGIAILCVIYFVVRTVAFFAPPVPAAVQKQQPVQETDPEKLAAYRAMSGVPTSAPANDLTAAGQLIPPAYPLAGAKKGEEGKPADRQSREAFDAGMYKFTNNKDYCGASVALEGIANPQAEFYSAASLLLCGRKGVALPKLQAIALGSDRVFAEEALMLIARSEIQSYNLTLATQALRSARDLKGSQQAEIARILKLLGDR